MRACSTYVRTQHSQPICNLRLAFFLPSRSGTPSLGAESLSTKTGFLTLPVSLFFFSLSRTRPHIYPSAPTRPTRENRKDASKVHFPRSRKRFPKVTKRIYRGLYRRAYRVRNVETETAKRRTSQAATGVRKKGHRETGYGIRTFERGKKKDKKGKVQGEEQDE